jgi:hypothetical protein
MLITELIDSKSSQQTSLIQILLNAAIPCCNVVTCSLYKTITLTRLEGFLVLMRNGKCLESVSALFVCFVSKMHFSRQCVILSHRILFFKV